MRAIVPGLLIASHLLAPLPAAAESAVWPPGYPPMAQAAPTRPPENGALSCALIGLAVPAELVCVGILPVTPLGAIPALIAPLTLGTGQWMAGDPWRGAAIGLCGLGVSVGFLATLVAKPARNVGWGDFLGFGAVVLGLSLASSVDAYHTAVRVDEHRRSLPPTPTPRTPTFTRP